MKHTNQLRVLGLSICFVLLLAAGMMSERENRVSAHQCPGDNKIEKSVRDRLERGLACAVFETIERPKVNNGVLTLTGTVPNEGYKRFAEELAKLEVCVRRIKNQLTLKPLPGFSGDCSTISDADLKKAILEAARSKLSCVGGVEPSKVQVSGRVVTLTGTLGLNNGILLDAAKSVCPGVEVRDQLGRADPTCPAGARSCLTLDGEQFCCTGCSVCPQG